MKKKNVFYWGVAILIAFALFACDKETPNEPDDKTEETGTKLVHILIEEYNKNGKIEDNTGIDFEYDDKGRIISLKVLDNGVAEEYCNVTYPKHGNYQITINQGDNRHFVLKLNEQSACYLLEKYYDGKLSSKSDWNYDKNGCLSNKSFWTYDNDGSFRKTDSTTITWMDGNISEIKHGDYCVSKYKYSSHKNKTFMFMFPSFDLIEGYENFIFQSWMGNPVKNLVSEEIIESRYETSQVFFDYELNKNGTVAVCTIRSEYGYFIKLSFSYE